MEYFDGRSTASRRALLRTAASAGTVALAGCSLIGDDAAIEAASEPLHDERLDLRAIGFDAGETVTLHAGYATQHGIFESRATFEAGDGGVVDVSEAQPVEGTYRGVDPMGLVWSMRRRGRLDDSRLDLEADTDTDSRTVPLTAAAYVDGERVASAEIDRRVAAPGVRQETPESDDLVAGAAVPPGEGPHPGTLLLHGGGGNAEGMIDVAQMLASRGVAACVVKYFGDEAAIPDRQVRVPLEYFDRAIEWFTGLDAVADGAVGVVGWSLGGNLAQLLGARRDDVGAVIAYSTLPYLTQFSTFADGPWSADGETLPYVEIPWYESGFRDGRRVTRPTFDVGFERADEQRVEAARIPVEEIDGPVLYVTGGDDAVVPAAPYCERAIDWLEESGHAHEYDHLSYESAGHSIQPPFSPTPPRIGDTGRLYGGAPAGIARADDDSWPTVLEYLEIGLR